MTRFRVERLEDRLTPAGGLDPLFSGDGKATLDFGGTDDARGVAVMADGRVVVAGTTSVGNDVAVARFLADGTPDASFGPGGRRTVSFGGNDMATGMALQKDGKVVVGGYTDAAGGIDFAVCRLNVDGTLDATFAGDGTTTVDFGHDDRANTLAIRHDGTILLAGSWDDGTPEVAVARLKSDGALDPTFGGDGRFHFGWGPSPLTPLSRQRRHQRRGRRPHLHRRRVHEEGVGGAGRHRHHRAARQWWHRVHAESRRPAGGCRR